MAGSGVLSVAVVAVDKTAGPLEGINKRLAKLNAPAERFNKALSKFGEVSGINRVSEGFGSLGRTAHSAFMSIDRVAGPLAAIASAGSIAGIVALTQRWADLGSTIGRTSFRLSMPVEKLSALQGAGQRFGSTADAVTQSLAGLRDTLYGGAFRGEKLSFLHQAGLDQAPGQVMDTMKAFDILADKVAGEKDVHTKLRYITEAGMGPSLLPLMNKGSKGVHEEMQRQADLGGTVTQKMTDDAIKTKQSFDDLGTAIGGVANKIGQDMGNALEGYAEKAAVWIGKNQELAKSLTEGVGVAITGIGTAITALASMRMAGWVARLLGLTAGEAASVALPAAGAVAAGAAGAAEATGLGAGAAGAIAAGVGVVPAVGIAAAAAGIGLLAKFGSDAETPENRKTIEDYRKSLGTGLTPEPVDVPRTGLGLPDGNQLLRHYNYANNDLLGKLANSQLGKLLAKGESGAADYNAVNRGAAGGYAAGMENLVNMTVEDVQAAQKAHKFNAAGRYQVIGPTLDSAVAGLGLTGKEKFDAATQDRIFEQYLVGGKRRAIGDYITGKSDDLNAALDGMSNEWASVADRKTGLSHYGGVGNNKASISVADATAALNDARGHVHVEVTLKGATQGTTAKVTSSGAVTVPPPRIETPMPGVM